MLTKTNPCRHLNKEERNTRTHIHTQSGIIFCSRCQNTVRFVTPKLVEDKFLNFSRFFPLYFCHTKTLTTACSLLFLFFFLALFSSSRCIFLSLEIIGHLRSLDSAAALLSFVSLPLSPAVSQWPRHYCSPSHSHIIHSGRQRKGVGVEGVGGGEWEERKRPFEFSHESWGVGDF